ncbi:serine/threonine-protein kinase [Isosphaeraceae bacterium EP7]
MTGEPDRAHALFLMAATHRDPKQRSAALDRECAADPALRHRVELLLRATEAAPAATPGQVAETIIEGPAGSPRAIEADGTLDYRPTVRDGPGDPPAAAATRPDRRPGGSEGPGSRIGPYTLVQKLGEGGMGAVYMADQEEPVRRRVALKIIKPGMDSDAVIARFEAERQAVALMDHPNIARVLDAGTTDSGRPFFVMELVHGVPITDYADDARLGLRERLALFAPVCHAIQHAHQKGLIHRDIKPSNVMVTLYDGEPVPKVIDFGIAKATDTRADDQADVTEYGSIVGTLEYMSPEQAEMSPQGVDTRSDIYSLGVLLYELLTGGTPLGRGDSGYIEILRRIKEEEPPRPSTRLTESAEALGPISERRNSEPARLAQAVRGELDWIVMKALEKDRSRRYETPNSLARDIQNFLDDEPVEACPPSARYRIRKFTSKYRWALATASAFFALLVLGAVFSTWQAIAATRAEGRALVEREKARRSEAEALAVLSFFQDQILAAARPEGQGGGLGKDVTLRRAVDAATPKIAEAFRQQPNVEASIRGVLGTTYHDLGEPALAVKQHERALDLRISRMGDDHPDTVAARIKLALAYRDAGRWDRAIPLLERTLAVESARLGSDHPDTLLILNNLALTYRDDGQWDRAIPLFERALAGRTASLGADHADTLLTCNNLAMAYRESGHWDRAIPLFESTLAAQTASIGVDHPFTLLTRNNLGPAYLAVGQVDRAITLLEQTQAARASKLGDDHPSTLTSRNNLALAYQAVGQLDRAIELFERTQQARVAKLGAAHPSTLTTRFDLAVAYLERAEAARAEPLLREVLEARKTALGAGHPDVALTLSALARTLMQEGKPAEAEPLLREALAIWETKRPDDWNRFDNQSLLGECLLSRNDRPATRPLLQSGHEGLKARESRLPAHRKQRITEAAARLKRLD